YPYSEYGSPDGMGEVAGLFVPRAGIALLGLAPPPPALPQATSARPPSRDARKSARTIVMSVRPPANVNTGGRPRRIWVVLVSSLSSSCSSSWLSRVSASRWSPPVRRAALGRRFQRTAATASS